MGFQQRSGIGGRETFYCKYLVQTQALILFLFFLSLDAVETRGAKLHVDC
jgi:hypothetical protein